MNGSAEGVEGHPGFFILQSLAREFCKPRLNPRRLAVFNGMTKNAIGVHEKYPLIFSLNFNCAL
jgi:hypothetical protein